MSRTAGRATGLSGWLREHLIGRLSGAVDCHADDFYARGDQVVSLADREQLPFDAYRGFLDPRDQSHENGLRGYRA